MPSFRATHEQTGPRSVLCAATHTRAPRLGQCVTDAPGPAKWHLLILEPIRIVLLYFAAYLLYYK
eukprot:scaffold95671_cov54-Phaeocystis_antarctica.AAC.2